MASFQWHLLIFVLLSLSAHCADEEKPKEKKQLSPSRLRAEGDAAFQNREYNKALKYFNQLIDIEPTVPKNFHKRALTYLFKSKYWKAVKDWGKAIKLDETFKSAYLYRGKTYKKLGKCSKALTDLNKVKTLNPSTKDIDSLIAETHQCINQYDIAMNLIDSGKCDEAKPIIDELLNISPYDNKLNLGLAKCAFHTAQWQDVLTYTANILRADPQNLDVLLIRGKAYYQMGEKDLALKHFKSGLKSDPGHKAIKAEFKKIKKIYRILDNAEKEMKSLKWRDALDSFATVLEIDPANNHLIKHVYIHRCKCATRLRNQKKMDPEDAENVVFEMNNEIRLALCDEAKRMNPDDGDAYFYTGKAFKEMKKWDEAVANFKTALSKNQGHREYQEELQNAEFEKKKANRKDYYGILGVSKHASPKELKKGFRKCGMEHHPDKVKHLPENERDYHEALFKECVEAHDFLSDPEIRAKYDRGEDVLGDSQGGNRGQGGFPGGFPFGGFQGFQQQGGGGGGQRTFRFKFGG